MKISKLQKQTYEKSLISMNKENKNTFNALKNQYISKINSTLFKNSSDYQTIENLEKFTPTTEFKFDMYEKIDNNSDNKKPNISAEKLEHELKIYDEKLSIFYKKDGIITRNDISRVLKDGLNLNKIPAYKANIYHVPFIYLCYIYQKTLREFSQSVLKDYPNESKNLDIIQNIFNNTFQLVSNIKKPEQTLYLLYQLIKMKTNLDTIISVVFDKNLQIDEQKINRHINNLSLMHNNFITSIKKENDLLEAENINLIHETVFKHLSMNSYYLLTDIYKSIQYDYYLLQKEHEDISWDMVKGKIASINFILDNLNILKNDFIYYNNMVVYLKKNRLLNMLEQNENPFYTYKHINQCLFKIVTLEVTRWLLASPEISKKVNIDLSSITKLEMKKLQGMINSNLNILNQHSILLPF